LPGEELRRAIVGEPPQRRQDLQEVDGTRRIETVAHAVSRPEVEALARDGAAPAPVEEARTLRDGAAQHALPLLEREAAAIDTRDRAVRQAQRVVALRDAGEGRSEPGARRAPLRVEVAVGEGVECLDRDEIGQRLE